MKRYSIPVLWKTYKDSSLSRVVFLECRKYIALPLVLHKYAISFKNSSHVLSTNQSEVKRKLILVQLAHLSPRFA